MTKNIRVLFIILSFFGCFTGVQAQIGNTSIYGKIFRDSIDNCILDISESGLAAWKIRVIRPQNDTIFTTTDALGQYQIPITQAGIYAIDVAVESAYWQPCDATKLVTIGVNLDSTLIDLGIKSLVNCPKMEVNVSAGALKKGVPTIYTVKAENRGTADAFGAYVEVDIDPFMSIAASGIVGQSLGNGRFRYQLDTLKWGKSVSFPITILLQNSAPTGATHCIETHIFPDNLCQPLPNFLASISANCNGNQSFFILQRAVNLSNNVILNSIVIEDDIVLLTVPDTLKSGSPVLIAPPAKSNTIYTTQVHLPNNTIIGKTLQRCDILDTKGYTLRYTQEDGNPFTHSICRQNEVSPSIVAQTILPLGRETQHFLEQNEDLEYTIRFQNIVANDTVKTIVIRDTLSKALNPSTLVMGASSHTYTWSLTQKGELSIIFNNVSIPDSSKNQLASKGFVSYKIRQNLNNQPFVKIKNKTRIQLGAQIPVQLNTYQHTVAKRVHYGTGTLTICAGAPTPNLVQTINLGQYDSTTFFKLKILPKVQETQNISLCQGQTYTVAGNVYAQSGTYQNVLKAQNGCDSILTTILSITSLQVSLKKEICAGKFFNFGNINYSQSGTYINTVFNSKGCDSTTTLQLTVLSKVKNDTLKQFKCVGKGQQGLTFTNQSFTTIKGCDSTFVIVLDRILADTVSVYLQKNSMNEIVFDGNIIKVKKDTVFYVENIKTANPCDFIKYFTNNTTSNNDISALIEVSVAPNPFDESTEIVIKNSPFETYNISIFDELGRLVRKEIVVGNRFNILKNNLSEGVYWLKMTHENIKIFDTKLVVF